MTREEASEKVAKLMRLAKDNANSHEAKTARSQARKIMTEHKLTVEEISAGQKAAAFDDLVAEIRKIIASRPEMSAGLFATHSIISGVLSHLESMGKDSKSKRLDEAYKLIEAGSMLNGALGKFGLGTPLVRDLKKIFDDTLAAHNLAPTH